MDLVSRTGLYINNPKSWATELAQAQIHKKFFWSWIKVLTEAFTKVGSSARIVAPKTTELSL